MVAAAFLWRLSDDRQQTVILFDDILVTIFSPSDHPVLSVLTYGTAEEARDAALDLTRSCEEVGMTVDYLLATHAPPGTSMCVNIRTLAESHSKGMRIIAQGLAEHIVSDMEMFGLSLL